MNRCFRFAPVFIVLAVCFSLVGCGGGGGGNPAPPNPAPPNAPLTTPVRLSLSWGARSRAVNAPSSALSVILTLRSARADGSDLSVTLNRAADPAAYTQSLTTSDPVVVGTWRFSARFHAGADGGGAVVGIAEAEVTIAGDGSGIGDIQTIGTIASVLVPPGQSLLAGETKDLAFTALDAANNIIAVSPGSAFFAVTTGADKLNIGSGQGVGVAPGTATVVATVDGKASPPQSVKVTSNATVAVNPPASSVPAGGTQTFAAAVTNAPDTGVTWSVREGTAGGSIGENGVYTAPTTAGTYHVVATSRYDPEKTAEATITVTVQVSVSPSAATLTLRDTQTFTASVVGSPNAAVTWSIEEGAAGGSITSGGVYTAPNAPGKFHVVATSQADPNQKARATVTVQAGSANGTIQ